MTENQNTTIDTRRGEGVKVLLGRSLRTMLVTLLLVLAGLFVGIAPASAASKDGCSYWASAPVGSSYSSKVTGTGYANCSSTRYVDWLTTHVFRNKSWGFDHVVAARSATNFYSYGGRTNGVTASGYDGGCHYYHIRVTLKVRGWAAAASTDGPNKLLCRS